MHNVTRIIVDWCSKLKALEILLENNTLIQILLLSKVVCAVFKQTSSGIIYMVKFKFYQYDQPVTVTVKQ